MGSLPLLAWSGFTNNVQPNKTQVNQGIIASRQNMLRIGLPFGLSFGIIIWLAVLLLNGYTAISLAGFGIPLVAGCFLGALGLGGLPVLQHYLLRLLLLMERLTPFNYIRFLDYAARLILLRKTGGGYQFAHRLLLDHFAKRDPAKPVTNPGSAAGKAQGNAA